MGELQEPGPEGTCSPPESQFFVAVTLVGKEPPLGSRPAHRWVRHRLEPLSSVNSRAVSCLDWSAATLLSGREAGEDESRGMCVRDQLMVVKAVLQIRL